MMPKPKARRSFQVILETPEGEQSLTCEEDEYLWSAAVRHGVWLPSGCLQGRCLSCAGKLLEGKVDHSSANTYFPEDEAAGYVLLCRALPLSSLRIRTHQAEEMRAHRLAHGLPAPFA